MRDARCEMRDASYRRRDFTSRNKKITREINFTPTPKRRNGFSREKIKMFGVKTPPTEFYC